MLTPKAALAQTDQIVIEREVLLQGVTGKPNQIIRLSSGEFIIVGGYGTAWAVGADANGTVEWIHRDSAPGVGTMGRRSDFTSAVALSNGNIVFCGQKTIGDRTSGLVTIVDSSGHWVEERLLTPNDDMQYFSTDVHRCLPWGDGVALVAGATNGHGAIGWLMRLDGKGQKQWEKIGPKVGFGDIVQTVNEDLVFTLSLTTGLDIVRLDKTGKERARRSLTASDIQLLRSITPGKNISLVVYGGGLKLSFITLNEALEDVAPEVSIPPVVISQGCGYILPDNSLVLFGYIQKGGDAFSKSYTGAIARVHQANKRDAEYIFEPLYSSNTAGDAVPISSSTFVTVRQRNLPNDSAHSGIVVSWVTMK